MKQFVIYDSENPDKLYAIDYKPAVDIGDVKTNIRSSLLGWICCDGKSIGKTGADYNGDTYRSLYDYIWETEGLSNISGNPFVISSKGSSSQDDWDANKIITIDFRNLFIRGKGTSRDLGSYQSDAMQGHYHSFPTNLWDNSGSNLIPESGTNAANNTINSTGSSITDGINGTPRIADETRPENVALNFFIKY
jgi:hypothetical protein